MKEKHIHAYTAHNITIHFHISQIFALFCSIISKSSDETHKWYYLLKIWKKEIEFRERNVIITNNYLLMFVREYLEHSISRIA